MIAASFQHPQLWDALNHWVLFLFYEILAGKVVRTLSKSVKEWFVGGTTLGERLPYD
jgi:hypothetical protein